MTKYLIINPTNITPNSNVLLIEISETSYTVPPMLWFCSDKKEYSKEKVESDCVEVFPLYEEVLKENPKLCYTWLDEKISFYEDMLSMYRKEIAQR